MDMGTLLPSLKCPTAKAAAAMCSASLALQLLSAACLFTCSPAPDGVGDAPRAPQVAATHAAAVGDPSLTRCMMLASHASAAVADVERRHEAAGVTTGSQVPDVLLQIIESELRDSGGSGGVSMHAAEHAFLITCLADCAAHPAVLALPLSMIQRLLDPDPPAESAGGTAAALVPAACMQLIAQGSRAAAASSLADSIAAKVLRAQGEWGHSTAAQPVLHCMQYAVAAVALGCRGPHSALTRPAALLSMTLRTPAALSDGAWAPLLLSAAALELGSAAGAASGSSAPDGLEQSIVEEVQHACTVCTAEGLWGCVVAALAAWWLLGPDARVQVLTAVVTRTLTAGQAGSACLSDALRGIEHMSGTTMSEFLVTQDSLLRHVGMSLADHPQARSAPPCTYMPTGQPAHHVQATQQSRVTTVSAAMCSDEHHACLHVASQSLPVLGTAATGAG